MKISVIIPTYRRPDYLARALRGLGAQRRPADEIVLGTRAGDEDTRRFLEDGNGPDLPWRKVVNAIPGVVASMQAAAADTTGEVVCLLDDDAEPLPDWIERIEGHFTTRPRLGMLGGRDLLQDHPELRRQEPLTRQVGLLTWYGRMVGNHHRGTGGYRLVDSLKGCNAAVRGPLLRQLGFEGRLRGAGAQVHWEVALCLDVAAAGWEVAYDPDLQVIHHIAPRFDADQLHRGRFSAEALYDMVWNEHFVVHSRCPAARRTAYRLWSLLVGSADAPGFVHLLRALRRRDPHLAVRWRTARRASADGRRTAEALRKEGA